MCAVVITVLTLITFGGVFSAASPSSIPTRTVDRLSPSSHFLRLLRHQTTPSGYHAAKFNDVKTLKPIHTLPPLKPIADHFYLRHVPLLNQIIDSCTLTCLSRANYCLDICNQACDGSESCFSPCNDACTANEKDCLDLCPSAGPTPPVPIGPSSTGGGNTGSGYSTGVGPQPTPQLPCYNGCYSNYTECSNSCNGNSKCQNGCSNQYYKCTGGCMSSSSAGPTPPVPIGPSSTGGGNGGNTVSSGEDEKDHSDDDSEADGPRMI